jgi:hypothetical protein
MALTKIRAGGYAAGGVIQVQHTQFIGTSQAIALAANTDTALSDLTVSITPTATSSKILLQTHVFWEGHLYDHGFIWMFFRDSTVLKAPVGGTRRSGISIGSTAYYAADVSSTPSTAVYQYFDSPSSTSAITYKVGVSVLSAGDLYINRTYSPNDGTDYERGISYISATEIAG